MKISPEFFLGDIHSCARSLLGSLFVRKLSSGKILKGKIVEVEVYTQLGDPASHSFKGKNQRNAVMFGPPGHLYVYLIYGLHYCCNIVCGPEGKGDAILIRALEPTEGIEDMMRNRFENKHIDAINNLTNGPAKLSKAMNISLEQNGIDLSKDTVWLEKGDMIPSERIGRSSRIGISCGKEHLWRYFIQDTPYLSKSVKGDK